MSGDNRKRAIRAIMAEAGMKYMAAMRELERREAAKAGHEAGEPMSETGDGATDRECGPHA